MGSSSRGWVCCLCRRAFWRTTKTSRDQTFYWRHVSGWTVVQVSCLFVCSLKASFVWLIVVSKQDVHISPLLCLLTCLAVSRDSSTSFFSSPFSSSSPFSRASSHLSSSSTGPPSMESESRSGRGDAAMLLSSSKTQSDFFNVQNVVTTLFLHTLFILMIKFEHWPENYVVDCFIFK